MASPGKGKRRYEEEEGGNELNERLAVFSLGHNMEIFLKQPKLIVNHSLAYREIPTAGIE